MASCSRGCGSDYEAPLRAAYAERLEAGPARADRGGHGSRCWTRSRGEDAALEPGGARPVQEAREGDRARRDPRHRRAHRRPRHRPRCGRSWPRSACCPGSTAAPCSPAARPRRWWWRRSAPARTSRSSTRSRATTASTSCCTTTSRPTRSARRASCARPAGARSATASSPGARSGRCCRRARAFPTRSGWSRRSPSPTAPARWRRSAAARSR